MTMVQIFNHVAMNMEHLWVTLIVHPKFFAPKTNIIRARRNVKSK